MKTEQEEAKHTPLPDFSVSAKAYATHHSNAPDKCTPDWIIIDFTAGANQCWNDYVLPLKSQLQQLQEEKAKSDSEVKTLREALIKCLCIFQRLADEGKYPDFMLQANGGEGFLFITSALQSKGGEQ